MRTYKVFIASSIVSFSTVRNKLVLFFNRLSKAVGAIYFDPFICEQSSKALSLTRKQDDFNAEIVSSDLFILIAGNHIGNYTLEELDVALNSADRTGTPLVAAFCESQSCSKQVREALQGRKLCGMVQNYKSLSEIEIAILKLLSTEFPTITLEEMDDGSFWINGHRIVSGLKLQRTKEGASNG